MKPRIQVFWVGLEASAGLFAENDRYVITFQGKTPQELEKSFRESIDFYLEMCASDGVPPDRPFSGRFNVRLNPEIHRKIAEAAAYERKSLNQWVAEAIEKALYQ